MDNANNPQMPPQQNTPSSVSPKPRLKRSVLFTIIAVIVAVVVVVAVVIIIYPPSSSSSSSSTHSPTSSTHFAFVPVGTVENLTGTTLTQYTSSYSNLNTINAIKSELTSYNSTSGGHIMIVILQFANTTECSNTYNTELKTIASYNLTMTNSTFNGFNYVYITEWTGNYYVGESLGYSGQYLFMILDENIQLISFNPLIQDQITAMS
jgi:hypothetical protein